MKVFFAIIGLMLAFATGLQFYIAFALDDDMCVDKLVRTPLVAGATLLSSFVPNFAWVYAKRRRNAMLTRLWIAIWIVLVLAGAIAAGASLGQAHVYADLECHTDVSTFPHYVTIVLLVFSITLPHAIQKRQNATTDQKPLIPDKKSNIITQTLQFI